MNSKIPVWLKAIFFFFLNNIDEKVAKQYFLILTSGCPPSTLLPSFLSSLSPHPRKKSQARSFYSFNIFASESQLALFRIVEKKEKKNKKRFSHIFLAVSDFCRVIFVAVERNNMRENKLKVFQNLLINFNFACEFP